MEEKEEVGVRFASTVPGRYIPGKKIREKYWITIEIIHVTNYNIIIPLRLEVDNINPIKRLRINREMTQTELAAACGVTQGTVAGWEK